MFRVVCPGSFDPPTNGHRDIIGRVAGLADEVVVAVVVNPAKKGLFTPDERVEMLRDIAAPHTNVTVESFAGLLVDFCRERGIRVMVKGLRAVSDYEYELQMAQMNRHVAEVETMFVPTAPAYSFVSSSLVKEVATYGGDVSALVPAAVHARLLERLAQRSSPGPAAATTAP